MRMLHAGGLLPSPNSSPPDYEDLHALRLPEEYAWLSECEGRAVKILDPHLHCPPRGRRYRFLLLTRDCEQQARSMVKFGRAIGMGYKPRDWKRLARGLRRDLRTVRRHLRRYPASAVLEMRFEEILADSRAAAEALAAWHHGTELDTAAMAGQVIHRDWRCLPGFLEEKLLQRPNG